MGLRASVVLLVGMLASVPLRIAPDTVWFATTAGRADYREISAFSLYSRWLQGQQGHVRHWAKRAAAHGATSVRVILTLGGPYWESQPRAWFGHALASGPQVPGFHEQLVPFVRAMAADGLWVRVVLLGDLHMFVPETRWSELRTRSDALDEAARDRVRGYVRQVVTTLADEPGVVWEVANEYGNIGLAESDAFVAELGAIVKALDPDALMNYSAPLDAQAMPLQWMRRPADFVSVHVSRDRADDGYRWLRDTADVSAAAVAHQARMPMLSGEPLNFGDARRDGQHVDVEPSPAIAFAYGAVSRVLRFTTTFHHDDGLWTAGWGEATERSLAAWKQGLDAVPMLDTAPTPRDASASPWQPEAASGGPALLIVNGAWSVAVGVPSGWDHGAALKPGRHLRVAARMGDGTRDTIVFEEAS